MNTVPNFSNNSNNSLFVGDLSKFCTESNLENLFAQFGQIVDVKIKRNNTTGKTLSYGFVYFANDECAARAMEKLNNVPFFGRNLRIRWAIHNAKAQKAPEESVINSVYVRFITPKVNEYVTEEAFHKVFDHFGCVVDVSIKESSVDQRTNRQSGYGFVHFSADNAGITAAFQAVSAVDNATIDGVTYNVELSKNLLKQFNEMNRNNAAAGQGGMHQHQSGTSSPVPIQAGMGLNPNAAVFGQSPHSQSPHGGPAPWPSSNGNAYGQNKFSPSNSRGGGGGFGGASPGYPMPMPPQMGMNQQAQMQQRYSPQAYSPPPGQIMGMSGMNGHGHQQPALGGYHKRTNSQPISSLLTDTNLQSMYRPEPYANAYGANEPHMGTYGRYGGESQLSAHGQYDLNQPQGQSFQQQQKAHFDPFQDADQFYEQDCERSHVSHASGGAHSSINSRSPHSISPLPGHSRRESEDFTQPAHPSHAHHVRQCSNGSHNSALYAPQGQSYGHGALDGGILHNADQFAHSAAYSPMSNGAISPMYDSDRDYGRYGANKPAPLNLNGLSTPNHPGQGQGQNQGLVHGGSSVSSTNSVRSLPSVPSGSTSPLPTGRAGGNGKPSGASYWESDAVAGANRADKPPTPAGNRAVGAPTRHGGLPMGPGQLNLTSNSCSSGSTSHESTPTHAYAKAGAGGANTGAPAAVSPTSAGVAAQYGQLSAGLAMGITPSLPPSGPLGRSGLQSRSSSTSSATTSTVGVFSGTVSPMPGQYGTTAGSGPSSARKPAGLTELDMHGINRSMSNGSDRNPALSTLCTTDSEGGFFNSNNSSFRLEHSSSTGASSEVSHREQQAVLASHIMLGGISLPSMLTDDRMELHKQAYENQGGRETFHNEYFAELKNNAPIEAPVVASRPQRLNMAMKQLSLQSVSTIGEDGAEDYLEDEFNYSSASSLSPKHSSSSLNLGLSGSASFRLDTSFMLSPQSSTQSLETSPFAQYANESFRGRPPSGSNGLPSAQTSIYPPNATAPALLRRTFQLDGVSAASHVDDEGQGEPEGINALAAGKDSRPVSLNSMTSNDSSQLAGIAIGSSSGEWEGRTDQGSYSPKEKEVERRSSRPEGIRLSRGKSSLSTTSLAIAEVEAAALPTPVENKVEAKADGGKRQLSLTQFFKPMSRATSAGEN